MEFTSEEIKNRQELDDIAWELRDEKFDVEITKWVSGIVIDILVRDGDVRKFHYSTIKETCERMVRYMKSEGWIDLVIYVRYGHFVILPEYQGSSKDEIVTSEVRIIFSKDEKEIKRVSDSTL